MAKYLKRDSEKGFVEDYVEIQSLKFNNVRHTVLGGMLGDFDDNGYYRVHPEIVKELIEMPKYVVEVMDNLEICLSTFKLDKQISFLVAYEGEKATLSLLEKVSYEANNKLDSGTWSNVNEYVLDVVETVGEIDRQALYIKWNIQTFPGEIIDIFNCEDSVLAKYFNIVTRFKYNLEAKTVLLKKEEELEEIEAEYLLDLFNILKDYPKLKVSVEKQIKQTLTEKKDFLKLDKPNFTKTLNEVVEKAIEDNVSVLGENQQDSFKAEKRNINVKANVKKYDIVPIFAEKIDNLNEAKNLEEIQEADSNISCDTNNKTVTNKLGTEDVRYKSLNAVAGEYVKVENEIAREKEKFARETLSGNPLGNVAGVVDLLIKTGVAATTLVSSPLIAAVAGVDTAEKAIEKSVDNVKKAAEKIVETEKKAEAKKDDKKNDKKKKEVKKPEKKKEEKKNTEKKPEVKKEEKKEDKKAAGGYSSYSSSSSSTNTEQKTTNNNPIVDRTLQAEKDLNKNDAKDNKDKEKDSKEKGLIEQLTEKNLHEIDKDTKETAMDYEKIIKKIELRKLEKNLENNAVVNQKTEKTVDREVSVRENATKIESIEISFGQ